MNTFSKNYDINNKYNFFLFNCLFINKEVYISKESLRWAFRNAVIRPCASRNSYK